MTLKLTVAQALAQYLAALVIEEDDGTVKPYVGGVWAIFGHGNVAGLGEALAPLHQSRKLPVLRAHNEQAMAHSAIAYAKAYFRRRIMAVTTSIGPGATNLVTACALAHVNRLPLLLLPGDIFASGDPDPVLQQSESFHNGNASVNDCLRPVSRYFQRLTHPRQILLALPRAIEVLSDPAECGPVTLALPQDVQTQSFSCPQEFLQPASIRIRRPQPDARELTLASALLKSACRPLIIAGGGVLYAGASAALINFAEKTGIPVGETQAGKSALPWDHPLNLGAIGVTGGPAANSVAREADLIIGVGTRLQDFTTGSHSLFPQARLLLINVQPFDAYKKRGQPLVADARVALEALAKAEFSVDGGWNKKARAAATNWQARIIEITATPPPAGELPWEAQIIGAIQDHATSCENDIVVNAAGILPAELHKLWRSAFPGGYHMDYGYSCMGYEIAGGLGVKMARPEREVIVLVGDGSYLMLNSEIATSVMLGIKLVIVVVDNQGYGCINRLQKAVGSPNYNNLLAHCPPWNEAVAKPQMQVDFAAHATSLGAQSHKVSSFSQLPQALKWARDATITTVLVVDTTPFHTTDDGGCWWEVPVAETSPFAQVATARADYLQQKKHQRT